MLLEDVFADVLEGGLDLREVLREAIHEDGSRGRGEEMDEEQTGDWGVL